MRPALLAALVTLALPGCTATRALRTRHHRAINASGHVTVAFRDGQKIQAEGFRMTADSVRYSLRGEPAVRALTEVRSIVTCARRPRAGATALRFGLLFGAFGGAAGAAGGADSCENLDQIALCFTRPVLGAAYALAGFAFGFASGSVLGGLDDGCTTYTIPGR